MAILGSSSGIVGVSVFGAVILGFAKSVFWQAVMMAMTAMTNVMFICRKLMCLHCGIRLLILRSNIESTKEVKFK